MHYCDHALSVRQPSSLTFHIFYFFSETTDRNSTKIDRKQDLNVLYQVCVFGADKKTRWPLWSLIGWDIFDFFFESPEQNSTKLQRKQDLNVLYQVCVFRADRKKRWPPWPLIGWDIWLFFHIWHNKLELYSFIQTVTHIVKTIVEHHIKRLGHLKGHQWHIIYRTHNFIRTSLYL